MNKRRLHFHVSLPLCLALAAFLAAAVSASEKPSNPLDTGRNFDARAEISQALAPNPTPTQVSAQERLARIVTELAVSYDAATGAARTLSSHTTYLTQPGPTIRNPLAVGLAFVEANRDLLGLTAADLEGYEITDEVFTQQTGATHLYLRQTHAGLPVYLGQLHFNVNRDGRLISVNNAFLPNLAGAVNTTSPEIDAAAAVAAAMRSIGADTHAPLILSAPRGTDQRTQLDAAGIARQPIDARLMWLPIRAGEARLVWNFQIETLDGNNWLDFTVDAVSAQVWTRIDWIADASYRVYPFNVESPNHTTPVPPSDARQVVVDPQDPVASPFGWHDTNGVAGPEFTIHRGNNTHSWEDSDGNDSPPAGAQPDCGGSLLCDFAVNLANAPSTYRPGAVSNLFYWTNIIHDVIYQYGFDEAGGNFQVNNYGRGGLGNDDVQSLAQSGQGNCNANFGTPPDGSRPRMRMFTCTNASPARDGDFDHGVIWHEYGHGISNRLVGGPSMVSCLGNTQQPGEGWGDWYGLATTTEAGDVGTTLRGMGTYLFGQPANGPGIRPQPYSTDPAINSYTYATIGSGVPIPHGLGSVWAQALWEVYWALIAEHGFDTDFYDGTGTAGNQRALLYVTEGMKNTACSPTFLNTRDGIIQAAVDNHGGEDVCLLWEAFAAFGLGSNASTPGPNSSTGVNGFNIPTSCSFLGAPQTSVDICAGQSAGYTITLGAAFTPPVTLSASGPSPSTVGFSPNPVNSVPGSSTMTVSNTGSVATGSYTITVNADDAAPQNAQIDVDLNVFSGTPGATTLTAPANGATSVPLRPTLTWTASSGAASYTVDVATDAGFTNVVYTAPATGTSHNVASNLGANTQYFWRVRPTNPCGNGAVSGSRSFTTVNLICATPNLAIPDNNPTGVFNEMVVATSGTLTDLDVTIKATHTFVGDLMFRVSKTGGPSVTIVDRPGAPTTTNGCPNNDVDATLDDEAANPVETQCAATPPAILGTFSPNNPLSAFDGVALAGTWRITVSDHAGIDVGVLTEWCLAPGSGLAALIFSDGFESGDDSAWGGIEVRPQP